MKPYIIAIKPSGTWREKTKFKPFITQLKRTLSEYDNLEVITLAEYKTPVGYDLLIEVRDKPFQWANLVLTYPIDCEGTLEKNTYNMLKQCFPKLDIRLLKRKTDDYFTNHYLCIDVTNSEVYTEQFKPYEKDLARVLAITIARELGFEKWR